MRRLLLVLCLALLLFSAPASAAITAVSGQEAGAAANDATLTLPAAAAVGNYVYILTSMSGETETISITGTTLSWSTVLGPFDSPGFSQRSYIFCAQGDGVDNTFTVTTSGSTAALSFAKEFAGISGCTAEDTEAQDDAETIGNSFDLDEAGTPLACSDGSLVIGSIHSTTNTTLTATTGATISTQQTVSATSWAQWRVVVGAGNYDTTWTANSNENGILMGACFAASAAASSAGGLLLLGVGQ
jgi:hypothetical protein